MSTKVAIVGSGFGLYCLLPAFRKVKGCSVVSICGKRSERLLSYCKSIGLDKIYTDWKQMLQEEKPDAVCIAVVPKYQYEIAHYALSNGIAVFAEKPLTTSFQTSSELYSLALKKGLPNMVDFIFPEIPSWKLAKEMLDKGAIGKTLNVSVAWQLLSYDLKNKVKSWKTDNLEGGGATSFFFCHVLYHLEYFLGRIKSIQCVAGSSTKSLNGGESIVNTIVLFESGCTGNIHLNIAYIGSQKHVLEFQGETGTLLLHNQSESVVDNFELNLTDGRGIQVLKPEASDDKSIDNSEDSRVKFVKSIAERFIGWCNSGTSSKPDFQDGLRVQELIEKAKMSDADFRGV
jgi:predicted dehydrogenase